MDSGKFTPIELGLIRYCIEATMQRERESEPRPPYFSKREKAFQAIVEKIDSRPQDLGDFEFIEL